MQEITCSYWAAMSTLGKASRMNGTYDEYERQESGNYQTQRNPRMKMVQP